MSNLLNVGTRALVANEVALQTIGNNIANASTVGYSRQTTVLQTVEGQYSGGGYIGKGVDIATIQRNHNEYLTRQAALSKSVSASDIARANKLLQLEDIFTGGKNGLGAAVTDMMNAFSDVASAPTDLTARTVVLTRADEAAARFNNAATQLTNLQTGLRTELDNAVSAVNTLTTSIAAVNLQLQQAKGNGQSPNDLLDKRDNLISQLNQYIQTTSIDAGDGTVTLFAASSQPLVLGVKANPLSVQTDPQDNTKTQIAINFGNQTSVLSEDMMGGGEIAGMLKFQNKDLAEGVNLLGRMAVSITTVLNAQHQLGLDLDGNAGGNLFSPVNMPNGVGATFNTGTGTIGISVDPANVAKLAASDYTVTYTSAVAFTVTRNSDNTVVTPDPVTGSYDGLLITPGGTPNSGDSFLLQPFRNAAADIGIAFASPRQLAVASPVQGAMGTTNTGSLSVANLTAKSVPIPAAVTLTFTGANTYTRSDIAGTFTYNPGTAIPYDASNLASGWSLTMSGAAQVGDTITLGPSNTSYAKLNAGNADALMDLRDLALFDGASLADGYASLMSQVGVRVQSVQYTAEVSKSIADNLETSRTGVSGVNLDEEAAKLLQYQQAYQASSKMIQIAQTIFDSLMASVGR
ncbi:flagellar hook-associated protein 1 FlgK [Rhodoferax sp. OV413]|uniref:flagellar hook-associated protein FlgK n=1 Tax=Rhodoferax sp. OV413 TaxID=1855285 RepID=UPI0008854D44|nr:flagellar hook-associated protein FlgK [Rhodoferax sp. OV413]SDP93522.1 flagellar hook-associated protein 1 FlgK [Rhodoferax sp. OV413]